MRGEGPRGSFVASPPAAGGQVARFAPYRSGSLPWVHSAAVGIAYGIGLAGSGAAAAWLVVAIAPCAWRPRAGLVLVVFACLGFGLMQRWEARPDPLAGRYGTEIVATGRSDGRTLWFDDPRGARAALAPVGEVPAGRVRVQGTLERPQGKRNPGGFDYASYLARRDVTGQLFIDEVLAHEAGFDLRGRLHEAATRGLPARPAALVAAMTLGVRDDLGDLRELFAAAGLAHVLALSGLHVGVLVAALLLLTRGLGRARHALVLVALAGFVTLVGPTPSVLRATIMVGAVLAARAYGGGRVEPWTALALAATTTLALRPAWLFDVSFQLSYLAVVGLLVFAGPLLRAVRAERLPWWHPRVLVGGSVAISVASQLPIGSLLMASFGALPILSPIANVLAVPLATLLVPLGFASAALGSLWPPLAAVPNLAVRPLAGALIGVAERAAAWPALMWGEVGVTGHVIYAIAIVALALVAHARLHLARAVLVWLATLGYAAVPPVLPEVLFLDVGQGDATLIRLPGRREVLIDGGGTPFGAYDVGAEVVVPALRALGVDELELVVATHPDVDHMEGLASILRAVPAQQLVVGVPAEGAAVYDALMEAAAGTGTAVRSVRRGEVIALGAATFEVLHPGARPIGRSNEDSVALLFRWRHEPVALFLGDVSADVERRLAVPPTPLLMVAHHGSRYSTSDQLLRAARPKRAVISVGRNAFGHPAPDVLERLEAHGVDVLATQTRGYVRLSVPDLLHP